MARILIIDDDPTVRVSFLYALKSAGHEVILASQGNEGIECYRSTPVDLVITDLFMPEKEGLETITELRREFPRVLIIAVSGGYRASGSMLHVAQALGAVKVLEKPFEVDQLLRMIDEVLATQPD